MDSSRDGSPAWLVLLLLVFIGFTTYAQQFATPVLLPSIGNDLGLNTAQLGIIWGMTTFGGLFLSLPGGLLGDKVGPKAGIFIVTMIVVISYGLRGLARDSLSLSIMMFIGGGVIGALPSIVIKAIFMWFPSKLVGSANGIWWSLNRVGMAAGSAVSATLLAPALNGWQNTFFLYGGLSLIFALLWLVLIREPANATAVVGAPFAESIRQVARSRDVWICSVTLFGIIGSFVGFVGYLPLYLQNNGWTVATSSLSLTAFLLATVITSLSIPVLSDKYRQRKIFFILPCIVFIAVTALMAVFKNTPAIWTILIIGGLSFGSLLPVINTMIAEIKGIGTKYASTATSLGSGLGGLGGLIFAWAAGKIAMVNAITPFLFCAGLCFLCLIPFFFVEETGNT
jgi:predicted MFS family arabinose efflux permease